MAHQPVIDGFEFASAGAKQRGVLPISEFPRLRDLLASNAGDIAYELEGTRDAHGRPSLRLNVRGVLQLRCQRCLGAMAFAVEAGTVLVLAATQAEIDADPVDPGSPDRILAARDMRVRDMVEDELILGLPYAPRHEHCAAEAAAEQQGKQSPFAELRSLIGSKQQH